MPGQMKINFKNFWGLDISKMVKVKRPGATGGSFQDTLLRGALTAVAPVAKRGALLNDSLNMISSPSGVISLLGSIPGVKFGSPSPDFTIAVGYTASAGAGVTVGGGAGVYFWNKKPSGEVGLYGSFSIGMMTNVG